jgi:hypothetical protein
VWREAQRLTHERCWPDVARLLAGLPPDLFRKAKLLEYDLALRYSATGQFKDIFLGVDHFPILSLSSWLLDDLDVAPGDERQRFERHLFIASVLLAARTHTLERIADADSFYDDGHLRLVRFLSDWAAGELAELIPRASAFWEQPEVSDLGRDHARHEEPAAGSDAVPPQRDTLLPGRWAAPARLLARAVTELAGRDEIATRVTDMLDAMAAAFRIRDDLASMHRDLLHGRPSYPIAVVAQAAGMPIRPWPDPTVVFGALVTTGSLPVIGETAQSRARKARETAADLRLATWEAYLADVVAGFEERLEGASGPLLRLTEPTLPKALAMAQAFLLADTTLRQSWEVHREGMFGAPEVTSRFPAGLVLEILCAHGHDLRGQVDEFLSFTDANRFRYYDHPWADADTDTIGAYLRLQPYASATQRQTDALGTVLGCLEREVEASGAVPVWLKDCSEPDEARPNVTALGEGCGTVAAHLLLGLLSTGRLPAVIEIGAAQLLDRIRSLGLAANVDYPRTYALAIFLRLAARLEAGGGDLAGRAREVRPTLRHELDRLRHGPIDLAQDAALLVIACFEAGSVDLIDPAWITTVLKRQRFDGGWDGEPFAAAPNRGWSMTWYASSPLTSALCYDALMRYARVRGA